MQNSGQEVSDHFSKVTNMMEIGKGGKRKVADWGLSVVLAVFLPASDFFWALRVFLLAIVPHLFHLAWTEWR